MAASTKPKNQVTATIVEGLTSSARVDRDAGMIRGVKLIGFDSKNGRYYPPAVLKSATGVYESAKVNIDHPERDPTQPRKYSERFGVIRNARFVEGQGVFADFQFNPKHPLAEQVCWDAENNPEALGFSHNALLRVGKPTRDGREQIEQIVSIRSMDLVADPATTKSLYESEDFNMDPEVPATGGSSDPLEMIVDSIAMKIGDIAKSNGDPKEKVKQIADLLKKQDKIMALLGSGKSAEGENGPATAEEGLRTQVQLLTEQISIYRNRELQQQRTEAIEKELTAAGLDPKNKQHVSELFATQLVATESVDARKALIADRAALVKPATGNTGFDKPAYTPQNVHATESHDAEYWAKRLMAT